MYRNYHILFSISIKHNYFTEEAEERNVVELHPTVGTQKKFNNYGLLFKEAGGRYLVLYKRKSEHIQDPGFINVQIANPESFTFKIGITDKRFMGYTRLEELEFKPVERVIALTNIDPLSGDLKKAAGDENYVNLSAQPHVSKEDFAIHSRRHLVTSMEPNGVGTLKIHQPAYQVGLKEVMSLELDGGGMPGHALPIEQLDEGIYYLEKVGSGEPMEKHFISKSSGGLSSLGFLEIIVDPATFYNSPVDYRFAFQRKQRFWKYYIIQEEKEKKATSFQISYRSEVNPNAGYYPDDIQFDLVKEENHTDRDRKIIRSFHRKEISIFQSNGAIPFIEQPLGGLILEKIDNGVGKVVIKHLPNPSVNLNNGEIFINL